MSRPQNNDIIFSLCCDHRVSRASPLLVTPKPRRRRMAGAKNYDVELGFHLKCGLVDRAVPCSMLKMAAKPSTSRGGAADPPKCEMARLAHRKPLTMHAWLSLSWTLNV